MLVSAIKYHRFLSPLFYGFDAEVKSVAMKVITQVIWMFALYCSLLTGIAHARDCPPKELLEPCTCEDKIFTTAFTCSHITSTETLDDVFRRSEDRNFETFTLVDSSLMYLPASFMETKRSKYVNILNVTMTSLFDDVPSDSELSELYLINATVLRGISWDQFENLSKLTSLHIEMTEVKSLGISFAESISKRLEYLIMYQTKTSEIDDHAFESLSNLVGLDLKENKIKTLKRSMFSRPAVIMDFLFADNEIESLPEDIFSDMPRLRVVSFRNNKISKFTESTFGGDFMEFMSYLDFENNPIDCDCSIAWFAFRNDKKNVTGTCAEPLDKKGRRIGDISKVEMDHCREEEKQRGINGIEAIFRS